MNLLFVPRFAHRQKAAQLHFQRGNQMAGHFVVGSAAPFPRVPFGFRALDLCAQLLDFCGAFHV